jgi:replication factor A1
MTTTSNNSKQTDTKICPIGMITPYLNGMWKIRARCFAKSPIRPHPVCNFDFVDASGEIRAVAFRDECTRFHPIIEVDKIYDILGVRVKTADKRWNNLRHTCELTFTPGSVVRLVDESTMNSNIPDIHFEFIPLREISKHSDESFIDVIGIVDTCSDIIPFTNRTTNRDSKRREITLIDEDSSISITLWDEQAENFDEDLVENKAVVAFQRIRVAIYNNSKSKKKTKNDKKILFDIL